jgi:hypothetical protein
MATLTLAYDLVVRTRFFFAGATEAQWADALYAWVHCYFDDTDGLVVTVTSDDGRLVGTCTFTQQRQSGINARNTIRHYIHITCKEGLEGSFFDVTVRKTIPADGDYEYLGSHLVVRTTDKEPEFAGEMAALTGPTMYVVEADAAGGEQDAYP